MVTNHECEGSLDKGVIFHEFSACLIRCFPSANPGCVHSFWDIPSQSPRVRHVTSTKLSSQRDGKRRRRAKPHLVPSRWGLSTISPSELPASPRQFAQLRECISADGTRRPLRGSLSNLMGTLRRKFNTPLVSLARVLNDSHPHKRVTTRKNARLLLGPGDVVLGDRVGDAILEMEGQK